MKTQTAIVTVCTAFIAGAASPLVLAQKGMGSETGVARQAQLPEVITLSGKIIKVDSHPCKKTTGRAPIGTHIILKTKDGTELNIHLGPAPDVKEIADQLKPGKKLRVDCFRTDQLPENNYVAKTLHIAGKPVRVRDDQLRPLWRRAAAAPGTGRGKGGPGRDQGRRGAL